MTPGITRRQACLWSAGSALWPASRSAAAEAYPDHPPHLVVPFTPGGSTDVLARGIGQVLGRAWNQAVVVDNVPGAGGSVGAEKVAKAPAEVS